MGKNWSLVIRSVEKRGRDLLSPFKEVRKQQGCPAELKEES